MNIRFRYDLINFLIKKFEFSRYLEIGLDTGYNFNQIECDVKISVDPALPPYDYANPTFKMTSDEFFSKEAPNLDLFDIVFIDGLHESTQVDRDIYNSINRLAEGGFVVLHDCNPQSKEVQEPIRSTHTWNGDVWKSVVKFKNGNSPLGCVVLNTDHGLGVISSRILKTSKIDYKLDYEYLEKNRVEYLGLIDPQNLELL